MPARWQMIDLSLFIHFGFMTFKFRSFDSIHCLIDSFFDAILELERKRKKKSRYDYVITKFKWIHKSLLKNQYYDI